ncbi:MAG: ATP-grasp domain-containing protein [Clostridium sp.]
MKTIVFIGTQKSGSSREAIKAADELGYYTVLLTDRKNLLKQRTEFPDVHLMLLCDLDNIEEIRKAIRSLVVKALDLLAIASFVDIHCYTAALLSEEFGLNHFTTDAIRTMLNKISSREVLSGTSYAPGFVMLSEGSIPSKIEIMKFLPFIMKSPKSTGSKDVLKITSYEEFNHNRNKLFEKYPGEPILIEEYLDGPQYLVETIVNEGNLNIIAIFKQEITFGKRFIITGYELLTHPEDDSYNKLKSAVETIISKHGLKYGPCHLEMRLVKEHWKLVEINPRISGGGMNDLVKAGLGINLVKETLKILIGQKPNLKPEYTSNVFAQYVTVSEPGILERVTGRNKSLKAPGVKKVYIKPRKGSLLSPPLSMGNRYAYVIATGDTAEDAKINAKFAASQISFKLISKNKKNVVEDLVALSPMEEK